MDINDFSYYNQLKNEEASLALQQEKLKQQYLAKMSDTKQLLNDYDVATIDELALALNDGDDDAKTAEIKDALLKPDYNFLLAHFKSFDFNAYQTLQNLEHKSTDLKKQLASVVSYYKKFVLPNIHQLKNNKKVNAAKINANLPTSDVPVTFTYFGSFSDFQRQFAKAEYVPEIIKNHLKNQTAISLVITIDHYPNKYDVSLVESEE